jgi:hypothetical protein
MVSVHDAMMAGDLQLGSILHLSDCIGALSNPKILDNHPVRKMS